MLITGGCGFIGSNFINYIDTRLINLDCMNYCASINNITSKKCINIEGNITDKKLVSHILDMYNIHTIIHFAAQSHVDSSFDNSLQYTIDNIYGTHVLLQCSLEYGKLKKFIHISSDEVYGEVDINHPGCQERSILSPTNPYSATKCGAEMLCQSYYHSFKLPIIIIRCNNVYGPNQYHEKLIPKFIHLLKTNQKLTIHGTGQTRRNFIWVDDVSSALSIVLEKGEVGQVYNIGTNNEYNVMTVAKLLIKKIKKTDNYEQYIEYVKDRPFNDFRYAIDATKIKLLGWEEKYNQFEENLEKLILNYK